MRRTRAGRWTLVVTIGLAAFAACWAILAAMHWHGTSEQLGIAAVPLAVVLARLGPWAEHAREHAPSTVSIGRDNNAPLITGSVTGDVTDSHKRDGHGPTR